MFELGFTQHITSLTTTTELPLLPSEKSCQTQLNTLRDPPSIQPALDARHRWCWHAAGPVLRLVELDKVHQACREVTRDECQGALLVLIRQTDRTPAQGDGYCCNRALTLRNLIVPSNTPTHLPSPPNQNVELLYCHTRPTPHPQRLVLQYRSNTYRFGCKVGREGMVKERLRVQSNGLVGWVRCPAGLQKWAGSLDTCPFPK